MKVVLKIILVLIMVNIGVGQQLPAPIAKKELKVTKIHGYDMNDNYFWLRYKDNPEVINYLEAENKYAESYMDDTKDFQTKIYNEILAKIKQSDLSVPVKIDNFYYYNRTLEGKNYPVHCRKFQSLDAAEEIILDENRLAEGKSYFSLGSFDISPDHSLLAYSIDTSGHETYTVFVKNLKKNILLPDVIENTSPGLVWAADNKTFFYTTLNDVQQADKVWLHILGQIYTKDKLVYQEKDNAYFLNIGESKDKSVIMIDLSSKDESEIWVIDSKTPNQEPLLIKKRSKNFEYYLESHNDDYFIWTNDNALNFKIMTVSKSNPAYANWREFIPYNEKIKINSLEPFKDFLAIHQREEGLSKLRIYDFNTKKFKLVNFPEKVYSYYSSGNPDFNTNKIRLSYTSLITPSSVYDYNMSSNNFELLKETEVLGGYNKNDYIAEQIFAKANDGTAIPISIVYKKGTKKDGSNPALLYSYGSYGYPTDPYFSVTRLSLLDRGFVYAIAHIRGGGEYGETWYRQGKMLNKMNTFTDFISCAEKLIKDNYTKNEKLVIEGGSAGGLLMGAVTNLRPDLFKVVLSHVPFVDVINTMMDPSIPLTVAEYTEWGNPSDKEYFDYMMKYSPYDNILRTNYPNILVRAGLYDPRVAYWEPAKYVAKLRDYKKDKNVLLLVTNMDAGHGGASGRYNRIKDTAFDFAFIFKILGISR